MMDYLNGYIVSIALVAVAWLLVIWQLRRKRKPEPDPDMYAITRKAIRDNLYKEHELPEPIQKYDRFPEPKRGPTKTVETRDGSDVPF